MEKTLTSVLTAVEPIFNEYMDVTEVVVRLLAKGILNRREATEVKVNTTNFKKNEALLEKIFEKRDDEVIKWFLQFLLETNQKRLVKDFNAELKKRGMDLIDIENRGLLRGGSQESCPLQFIPTVAADSHAAHVPHPPPIEKDEADSIPFNACPNIETYPFTHYKVLIINNIKFPQRQEDQKERKGAARDEEVVVEMWMNTFGKSKAELTIRQNCDKAKMTFELKDFAASMKNGVIDAHGVNHPVDGCFVFIMTHGDKEDIICTDEQHLPLLEVFDIFGPDNCKALQHKPKIFFLQACRGSDYDIQGNAPKPDEGRDEPDGTPGRFSLMDDFLVAFATGWGKYSLRNTLHGSYFIRALVQVVSENRNRGDTLEQLLKKVQLAVRQMRSTSTVSEWAQSPGFYSHLSKDLIIRPK